MNGLGETATLQNESWPRYIRTTDFAGPRELRDETKATLPPNIAKNAEVRRGDILMSAAGTVGKTYLYDSDDSACYAGYLVRFRPRTGVEPRFVAYWTETPAFLDQIESGKVTSTIDNFSAGKYQNLSITVPGTQTQRVIADFLDTETARIDALIAKKRQLRLAVLERAAAYQDRLVLPQQATVRKTADDVPQHEEVPGDWAVAPLGILLTRITYGFTSPMPTTPEGPFMLTANDIGDGAILWETARRTDESAYAALTAKSRPQAGDVLVTKDGTLGRVALFDGDHPVCVNQSVAVLTPRRALIRPELLAYLLASRTYNHALVSNAGGTTIKHLYITRMAKQRLAFPHEHHQQDALCRAIGRIRERSARLVDCLDRSVTLLQEHRQALITAAVTGEFEVPGVAA